MKKPEKPPTTEQFWAKMRPQEFGALLSKATGPLVNGKYLHWDQLRHRPPPDGLSTEEWWFALKLQRRALYKPIPLTDQHGRQFRYLLVDPIPERLHQIDLGAGGLIQMPEQITNPETRDRYYVGSLMEEAITSSQLEGATTTRRVAKDMIRAGREPRDRSERMILNNYLTMKRIGELKHEPLTRELIFEIHRLVTDQTLDDASAAGRFRRRDEQVVVGDDYGEVFHHPPPADQLEQRMAAICDFANTKTPRDFIPPALRSIILHFWLSYDHPFIDGNGRTARALFYWSMLRCGYWLCEFISISHIILKAPTKYGLSFLYSETDDNDLTYFILYHLEVLRRAVEDLHEYIKRKTKELQRVERELRGIVVLNHRQRALIGHALRHPNQRYTIESHRRSHNVVYQTARTDLQDLERRGLFRAEKIGKRWFFSAVDDFEASLRGMA